MKNNFRQFSEMLSGAICEANVKNTNEYTPKVQSTVRPAKKSSYNEIHEHIRKQLNK
jgi:hypothetical protein